jgi:hypothetical protein
MHRPLWNTQNNLAEKVRLGAIALLNQRLADAPRGCSARPHRGQSSTFAEGSAATAPMAAGIRPQPFRVLSESGQSTRLGVRAPKDPLFHSEPACHRGSRSA